MIAAAEARRKRVIVVPSRENRRTSCPVECGVSGGRGENTRAFFGSIKARPVTRSSIKSSRGRCSGPRRGQNDRPRRFRTAANGRSFPRAAAGPSGPAGWVQRRPACRPISERMLAGALNSRAGTRFNVCWVCFWWLFSSNICSALPWSAVTNSTPPAFFTASIRRPRQASTASIALMAAARLPVWPTMSLLA